ncbi:MAG: HEAT repeat domain-containing protein [Ignavibacteriaceae bacterium]
MLLNPLKQLKSDDPSVRSMAVEALINESLTDEVAEMACSLVEDSDKGVLNSVDLMLTLNTSPQIPYYLVKYISSTDISTRNLAGEILLKIGSNAVNAMVEYLKLANNDDRKFIVDILGLIGDPKVAPDILELLKSNSNDNVVMACIEALGNLHSDAALEVILSIYERNELFKPTIIEAIGKIGTSKALDFIFLKYNEEDDLTKFSMIESLGLIGNEEAFFFLLSELNEIDGPLIWPTVESIFLLKEKFMLNVPYDERMKNMVLKTSEEAPAKYKKPAANLLTAFDGDDTFIACLKIYGEDIETDEIIKPKIFEKPYTFFEIISSIINQNPGNLKNLLGLTLEVISLDKEKIKDHLSNIQMRNLTDSFTRCLDNPDEETRKLATENLFAFDQDIALLFLDKILEDDNIWNKLWLLEILGGINSSEAEHAISELANDKEEMISERAKFIQSQKTVV